ncbi:hypothetical protein QT343_25655 [Escherichia coli]|nr:hypothetical protein [Escherichia coli]
MVDEVLAERPDAPGASGDDKVTGLPAIRRPQQMMWSGQKPNYVSAYVSKAQGGVDQTRGRRLTGSAVCYAPQPNQGQPHQRRAGVSGAGRARSGPGGHDYLLTSAGITVPGRRPAGR